MRILILLIFFTPSLWAQKNYEFKNGNWYNGKDFTSATWYTANGKFTKKAPSKIDSVIDLKYQWVIPPMGDAFSTCLTENPSPEMFLHNYANEGIFYVQILGNTKESRMKVEAKRIAESPELVFANGELTCTLGEPFLRYEAAAQGLKNANEINQKKADIQKQRKGLGDGYWFIDSKEALAANWIKIKALKPGVIAIELLDAEKSGGKEGKGLSADVAKMVVKKAHKSDLKVFARVENAADIRLALQLGVDGIAGLPGADWNGEGNTHNFDLTEGDMKLMVKKKTIVIPMYSKAQGMMPAKPAVVSFQSAQLKRLFAAGVNVVIGSNDQQRTTRSEMNYWFNIGDLDVEAALRAVCETTPRAIFPDRKIGRIDGGYEASFLVLNDNPLNNLLKVRSIQFKVKNGAFVK